MLHSCLHTFIKNLHAIGRVSREKPSYAYRLSQASSGVRMCEGDVSHSAYCRHCIYMYTYRPGGGNLRDARHDISRRLRLKFYLAATGDAFPNFYIRWKENIFEKFMPRSTFGLRGLAASRGCCEYQFKSSFKLIFKNTK